MLSVSVQDSIYTPYIEQMRSGNPWGAAKGQFYLLTNIITPYKPTPTILKIETDAIGSPINIEVSKLNPTTIGIVESERQDSLSVVASSSIITVPVQLGRGINMVVVSTGDQVTRIIIRATTLVALWEAWVRVFYQDIQRVNDNLKQAVYNQTGTRLIEPYIEFQDLFPDVASLQILATRLVARGLIHTVGTKDGVDSLTKALTLSTPAYRKMDKDTFEVYPSLDPWTRIGSANAGLESHVWIPNVGIMNWIAFIKYLSAQPDTFRIIEVQEGLVIYEYQGTVNKAYFDFDSFGSAYLNALAKLECFNSIRITASIISEIIFSICTAAYSFDLYIDEDHPIGNVRRSFDIDLPFDSGVPFDSDDTDPYPDGWVGLSLTGRFEMDDPVYQHCLDSHVFPSQTWINTPGNSICCYDSFYTQCLLNHRQELDLDLTNITISGQYTTAFPWVIEDSGNVLWRVNIDPSGTIVTEANTTLPPSQWYITGGSGGTANFSITTEGVVIVNSPQVGGLWLLTTPRIGALDGTVWDIVVNPDDTITLVKIFPV